jgi:hypothetical protein
MKKKILFITGTMNQTTQMLQIAHELPEYDCWFSQIFADSPLINFVIKYTSLVNTTIISNHYKTQSEDFLREKGYQIDYSAALNQYDLVVYCSDLVIPDRLLRGKTLWVQEGMTDPYSLWSKVVRKLNLPPYLTGNTSLNGSSNVCDIYCAASEGYKDYFTMRGTEGVKFLPRVFLILIIFDNINTMIFRIMITSWWRLRICVRRIGLTIVRLL